VLTVVAFIGELPWVLLMDEPQQIRSIYGTSVLRIHLAHFFGAAPSLNIFGWLQDLEKAIPWLVTIILFLRCRALIRKSSDAFTGRFPIWVFVWGLVGAGLITWHYADAKRPHYSSYENKGLLDALNHLLSGSQQSLQWTAIMLYRLTYLLLAPWMYFVLFATTAACITQAWRLLPSAVGQPGPVHQGYARIVGRLVLLAGLPPFAMLLLHDIATFSLGYDNFDLGHSRKRFLMYAMYACFLVSSATILKRARDLRPHGGATALIRVVADDAKSTALKTRTQVLSWAGRITFIAMVVFPALRGKSAAYGPRESELNRSIARCSGLFLSDYTRLSVDRPLFDTMVKDVIFSAPIAGTMSFLEDPRASESKALVLASIGLLRLGFTPRDIATAAAGHLDAQTVSKRTTLALARYPMFATSPIGRKKFNEIIDRLLSVVKNGYENAATWHYRIDQSVFESFVGTIAHDPVLQTYARDDN
jgi:hypothetical protein